MFAKPSIVVLVFIFLSYCSFLHSGLGRQNIPPLNVDAYGAFYYRKRFRFRMYLLVGAASRETLIERRKMIVRLSPTAAKENTVAVESYR
jgi:hypothetical protein